MKIKFWTDNLWPAAWSVGLEFYCHSAMMSRGKGPEYGAYIYLGWRRFQIAAYEPMDLKRIRETTPVIEKER